MSAITILTLLVTSSVLFYFGESSSESSSSSLTKSLNPLKVGGSSSSSKQPRTPRPSRSKQPATPRPSAISTSSSSSRMSVIDEEEEQQFEQQKQDRMIIALRLKTIPYLEYSLKGEDIVANSEFFGRLYKSKFFPNIHSRKSFVKFDYPHARNFHFISKTAWLIGVYTWLLSTNNCHLILLMKKAADAVEDIDKRIEEQGIKPPQLTDQDEREEKELHDRRQRLCALQRLYCEREEAEDLQRRRQFREQCLQKQYDKYDLLKRQSRQRRQGQQHQTEQKHLVLQHQQEQLELMQRKLQEIHLGKQQQYHQLQINQTQRETDAKDGTRREERIIDRRYKAMQRLQELQQDPHQYQEAYNYLNPSIMRGYPRDPNRNQ